jgi:hypothetical protein
VPIILRYVSADGKKTASRALKALPAKIRVPEGAKVEVVDTKTNVKMTLAQYVNTNAERIEREDGEPGAGRVEIETVSSWPAAVAWLEALPDADLPSGLDVADYEPGTPADEGKDGEVLGMDRSPLLIGGLVGLGLAGGAAALAGGGGGGSGDDLAPIAPSNMALATEDDSGVENDDGITNVTSGLTITGNAEPGSMVELFEAGESLGTATATADGTFSIEVDLALAAHSITATATDAAGNVSALSSPLVLFIDDSPPSAVEDFVLAQEDDTGSSPIDGITSKSTALTFSGTAEPSGRVELFDGDTSLGVAVVASDGTWLRDVVLSEGTHTITAVARDIAGNEAEEVATVVVTVDNTVPAAPTGLDLDATDDNGSSNSDNVTSVTDDLTISGTTEAGATVRLFTDGGNLIATVVAGTNGVFVADIDLAIGTHQITARATDVAGNLGPSSETLVIEVVDPQSAALSATAAPLEPLGLGDLSFSAITFG